MGARVKMSTSLGVSNQRLVGAAKDGDIWTVKELLKANTDVNGVNNQEGTTALMMASFNGHEEVVKVLLKAKAKVDLQNMYGNTALMAASAHGHKEVVKLLEDAIAKASTTAPTAPQLTSAAPAEDPEAACSCALQ